MRTDKLTGLGKTTQIVKMDDGSTEVRYHSTSVVTIDSTGKRITLRTGGRKTAATKIKMNQVARVFNLPYHVYQERGRWYLRTGKDALFPYCNLVMGHTQEIVLK